MTETNHDERAPNDATMVEGRESGSPSTTHESRPLRAVSPWLPAAVTFVAALLLRGLYVLQLRSSPLFDLPIMDAEVHDRWARGTLELLHGGIPYFRAPLYPWMMSAVYWLDDGYLGIRLVQALLSALTVALVADLGRRIGGMWAGLLAGMLLAFCWPSIYFAGELLIVTQATLLIFFSVWLLVVALDKDRPWLAAAAAAVLGLASISRPTALAFLPVLVLVPVWIWPHVTTGINARRRWSGAMALVGIALIPGLALTVRNKAVGDDWVFIASQGGVNFYIGNNPQSDGRTAVVPGTRSTWLGGYNDTIAMARRESGRPLQPSEVSRFFYRKGLRYWVDEPGDALALYARKLRLLLGAGERSNNKNIHFFREQSPLLRLPIYTSWAPIFALGLVGIFLCRRKWLAAPVLGLIVGTSLLLLLFFVNERFRLPLLAGYAVFAGIPVVALRESLKNRQWKAFALVLVAVLGVYVLSQLDKRGFKESVTDADAFSRYTLGNAYLRKKEYQEAVDYFDDSLATARRYGLRHFEQIELNLRASRARALIALSRFDEAENEIRWLEAIVPDDPMLLYLRAELLGSRKDWKSALGLYKRALVERPNAEDYWMPAAWCFFWTESFGNAQRLFEQILEKDPDNGEAMIGVGACIVHEKASLDEAEYWLLEGLETEPENSLGHHMMGVVIIRRKDMSYEQMDRLRFHFAEVIRLDPGNKAVARFIRRSGWWELLPDSLKTHRRSGSPESY